MYRNITIATNHKPAVMFQDVLTVRKTKVESRESDYGVMTNFRVEGVVYSRQVEGK